MKRDSTSYSEVRPTYDKGDCSVRALAVGTGCTYEQASAVFSAAGRQMKHGTSQDTSHKVHVEWLKMKPLENVKGWSVAAFIAANPSGTFILHRRRHAFAVVNGVLHDWEIGTKARSKIVRGWEVTQEAKTKMKKIKELF